VANTSISKDNSTLCTAFDALFCLILILNLFIYCAAAHSAPAKTTEIKSDVNKKDSPDAALTAEVTRMQQTDVSHIVIYEKSTGKRLVEQDFPGEISEVQWLPDSATIVYMARSHANSPVHLFSTNAAKNLSRDLTPFGGRNVRSFIVSKSDSSVIASINLDQGDKYGPWLIDTTSGATTSLTNAKKFAHVINHMKHAVTTECAIRQQRPLVAAYFKSQSNHSSVGPNSPVHYTPGHFAPAPYTGTIYTGVTSTAMWQGQPSTVTPTKAAIKGQEKYLKRIEGNGDQRIIFYVNNKKGSGYKNFSDAEKKQVLNPWRWICKNAPGLALRATHNHRLNLSRRSKKSVYNVVSGKMSPAASADVNEIIFYDGFFDQSESEQLYALAHELVHTTDMCGHLSMSRQWLDLVQPEISQTRETLKFGKNHETQTLDDVGARYLGLPSVYAATDSQESLAEWGSRLLLGRVTSSTQISKFIEEKVFDPDCAEQAADRELLKAFTKIHSSNQSEQSSGLIELEKLVASEPHLIAPKEELACQYMKRSQYKKALKISNALLHEFDSLKVENLDLRPHSYALFQHGSILCALHDYDGANLYLNRAIAKAPHEEEFLSARKWMNKNHKTAKYAK
jgi:hypothetical protein